MTLIDLQLKFQLLPENQRNLLCRSLVKSSRSKEGRLCLEWHLKVVSATVNGFILYMKCTVYTLCLKKATWYLIITLANVDRFSKLFHHLIWN